MMIILPVYLKAFKSINIQDSNLHLRLMILPNRSVNLFNKPETKIFRSFTLRLLV